MSEISKREFLDVLTPFAAPNYFQTLMTTRVLYCAAINRELLTDSPVAHIKAPKSRPKTQKFLTWEKVSATNFGKHDEHIKFLALHRLRCGEAIAQTEDDIYDDKVLMNMSMYGPTKTESGVREDESLGVQLPRSLTY
jgi:integrase